MMSIWWTGLLAMAPLLAGADESNDSQAKGIPVEKVQQTTDPQATTEIAPTAMSPAIDAETTAEIYLDFDDARPVVFTGVGVYFLQPRWNSNIAFSHIINPIDAGGVGNQTTAIETQFSWNLRAAPVAWIGILNEEGYGARLRYFHFDQGTTASYLVTGNSPNPFGPFYLGLPGVVEFAAPLNSTLSATPNGSTINVGSGLSLNVWDAEGIKAFKVNRYAGQLSAGVRYAHIAQNYNSLIVTPAIPFNGITPDFTAMPAMRESFSFGHNFNGAGLTFASDNRIQVLGEILSLYANARGSLLFGRGKQTSILRTTNRSNSASDAVGTVTVNDVMPIIEMEMGVELRGSGGLLTPFLQVGAVGQVWFGAGNSSMRSASIAAAPVPSDEDLALIGIRLTGGFDY